MALKTFYINPRSSVYPYLYPLMNAALGAGAHAVYLSGAGPTVLAITFGAAGDTLRNMDLRDGTCHS